MIVRYVLETCRDVAEALAVLRRVQSHMDYNLVLADARGCTASVELHAGGGLTLRSPAIATNHQRDAPLPERADFTRTVERHAELAALASSGGEMGAALRNFLEAPLRQTDYANGFGTLFTASFDPRRRTLRLVWPKAEMFQSLDSFEERCTTICYESALPSVAPSLADAIVGVPASSRTDAVRWLELAEEGHPDWIAFGALFSQLGTRARADLKQLCKVNRVGYRRAWDGHENDPDGALKKSADEVPSETSSQCCTALGWRADKRDQRRAGRRATIHGSGVAPTSPLLATSGYPPWPPD